VSVGTGVATGGAGGAVTLAVGSGDVGAGGALSGTAAQKAKQK
jgi:hypothetical protein